MRVLLDTHALIWALTDAQRLGPDAGSIIRRRDTELVVSASSAWELATKVRLGKLPPAAGIVDSYPEHLARLGAQDLPVTAAHALLAGSLRWAHRDPFDRMIGAQAIIEGLTLLTADPAFSDLAGLRVRW